MRGNHKWKYSQKNWENWALSWQFHWKIPLFSLYMGLKNVPKVNLAVKLLYFEWGNHVHQNYGKLYFLVCASYFHPVFGQKIGKFSKSGQLRGLGEGSRWGDMRQARARWKATNTRILESIHMGGVIGHHWWAVGPTRWPYLKRNFWGVSGGGDCPNTHISRLWLDLDF